MKCKCGQDSIIMGMCKKCYTYRKAKPNARHCTKCGKMTIMGDLCRTCITPKCKCGNRHDAYGRCKTCNAYLRTYPDAQPCIICTKLTIKGICVKCTTNITKASMYILNNNPESDMAKIILEMATLGGKNETV